MASPFIILLSYTTGLSGNNLIFANYLNDNAPFSVRQLFAPLQGRSLASALESAAPTRNAFLTFVSQTTQLSLERLVNDHLGQQRWRNHKQTIAPQMALREDSAENLIAEADEIAMSCNPRRNNKKERSSQFFIVLLREEKASFFVDRNLR